MPFSAWDRRVPGLRREEVAALAGVSLSYYTRLERGDTAGVSDWGVLADELVAKLRAATGRDPHDHALPSLGIWYAGGSPTAPAPEAGSAG